MGQRGRGWSRDLFLILGPLYISETAEATNFKYGVQIDYKECYRKMRKEGWKGFGLSRVS